LPSTTDVGTIRDVRVRDDRGMTSFAFGILLVIVVYGLLSVSIAMATIDKCDDRGLGREWHLVPPRWDCVVR
jgi:hypothetical protein